MSGCRVWSSAHLCCFLVDDAWPCRDTAYAPRQSANGLPETPGRTLVEQEVVIGGVPARQEGPPAATGMTALGPVGLSNRLVGFPDAGFVALGRAEATPQRVR